MSTNVSYYMVGGDGQRYGPVPLAQLRQWLSEGRANGQTLIQAEGGIWKPLGSYPEFADVGGAALSPQVPTPPPIGPPPPVRGQVDVMRTNSAATAALVLSGLGLVCCGPLFSTIGLVLAIVAIAQINRHPAQEGGKGLALTAVVLALLGYLLFGLFLLSGLWQHLLRSLH